MATPPAAESDPRASHDSSSPRPTPMGAKIVVIDDETAVCAMLAAILADAGYTPVVTSDSREAVQLVRRERPALVLVDIAMPYVDGYAVASALREDPLTRDCAVVFITGHLAFSNRVQAFRTGARDYVTKPFTSARLLATVARALQKRPVDEPAPG